MLRFTYPIIQNKKILFLLLSFFFLLCEGQEAHFYLSDYGAVVNKTNKTNGHALQKILAEPRWHRKLESR